MRSIVVLLLVAVAAVPAYAEPITGPMPKGTTCTLPTDPPQTVTATETVFPCTRIDINDCNSAQRENARLKQLLLDAARPPASGHDWWTTTKVAFVFGAAAFVGGIFVGAKL